MSSRAIEPPHDQRTLSALADPVDIQRFLDCLDWFVREVRAT
jgi:hypothetical protein